MVKNCTSIFDQIPNTPNKKRATITVALLFMKNLSIVMKYLICSITTLDLTEKLHKICVKQVLKITFRCRFLPLQTTHWILTD